MRDGVASRNGHQKRPQEEDISEELGRERVNLIDLNSRNSTFCKAPLSSQVLDIMIAVELVVRKKPAMAHHR